MLGFPQGRSSVEVVEGASPVTKNHLISFGEADSVLLFCGTWGILTVHSTTMTFSLQLPKLL